MRCEIEAELTPERFAEAGEPCRLFRDEARGLVALMSVMPQAGRPGRWLFVDAAPPVHRLSVYRESDGLLLGLMTTRFPIQDVAFDPHGESVLVATGSYDGGWFFNGFLLRHHWRTGITEQMLGCGRDALACRYNAGGTITVLLRPENEEEFDGDAWNIVLGLEIDAGPGPWHGESAELCREDNRLAGLRPSRPSDHGFSDEILKHDPEQQRAWAQEAAEWLRGVQTEPHYYGIRDLMWLDAETFAVAANGLLLEVREVPGSVRQRFATDANSVELIRHPRLGLLAHVQRCGPFRSGSPDAHSELWRWQNNQMHLSLGLDRLHAFSFDVSGHGLAVDVSWANHRQRKNLLLSPEGHVMTIVDCGNNNRIGETAFPHGLDALYFLKRESEEDFKNQGYRMWRHEGGGRFVQVRPWDPLERNFCPVAGIACSEGLFLGAGPAYDRTSHQQPVNALELMEMQSGRRLLSITIQGSPTRVALTEDKRTAAVGIADGGLTFFDMESRRVACEIRLEKHGMPSVPLALAFRGGKLLIGTQDGRVLLGRLVE